MSKRIYTTFGGRAYDRTIRRIFDYAKPCGADELWIYDDKWLVEQEFYRLNQKWWSTPDTKYNLPNGRGFGWFIWKPFIMMHALSKCQEGDIVLFTDADTFPVNQFGMLYDRCHQDGGIMLFEAQGCNHLHWCKDDTHTVMGQQDLIGKDLLHACARFFLFEKGPWIGQQFLAEWLAYCLNPLANTFDVSRIHDGCRDIDGDFEPTDYHLQEARCEQAILTNLAHKYGLKLYREACQAGNDALSQGIDTFYPQLFEQLDTTGDKFDLRGSLYRSVPA